MVVPCTNLKLFFCGTIGKYGEAVNMILMCVVCFCSVLFGSLGRFDKCLVYNLNLDKS